MSNTKRSFKDKWFNNPQLAFASTLAKNGKLFKWILKRNGFSSLKSFKSYLLQKRRILDAGCGNGRVTALMRKYSNPNTTEIIGIDLVAASIAEKNLTGYKNVKFYQKDILKDLQNLGKFDFIYCQEVLHHTGNPLKAFLNLCALLDRGGEIAVYVYKKKAPIREYTDDYIRNKIAKLPYKEAIKVCTQIAELGKSLSKHDDRIDIPQVDILEIEKGKYSLQRFVYHFFMKCYWSDEFSMKDNAVLNYDWYHPKKSSKHTLGEVKNWFNMTKMKIIHEYTDFYGITVWGKFEK